MSRRIRNQCANRTLCDCEVFSWSNKSNKRDTLLKYGGTCWNINNSWCVWPCTKTINRLSFESINWKYCKSSFQRCLIIRKSNESFVFPVSFHNPWDDFYFNHFCDFLSLVLFCCRIMLHHIVCDSHFCFDWISKNHLQRNGCSWKLIQYNSNRCFA